MNPPRRATFWQDAEILVLEGDLIGAADVIAQTGAIALEAQLRKHAGFRLLPAGRTADAEVEVTVKH